MLKNYIKIAWRNILKNHFYSAINILGLTAGISFVMLIGAYIFTQLQVNRNLKNANRQYIIQSRWKDQSMGIELTALGLLSKELHAHYPDLVENYLRYDPITVIASKGEKNFRENLMICDSTLLGMYGFPLLYGNPKTALKNPYSLILTAEKARTYFGKTDVVGQTITIAGNSGDRHAFLITGVMEKPGKNAITYLNDANDNEFIVSTSDLKFFQRTMDWGDVYIVSFITLKKGVKPEDLDKPMAYLVHQNTTTHVSSNYRPYLVPLTQYHLDSVKPMLYALSAIAFFILLMALINFMNVAISRSVSRLREIGVRKVLGSLKSQLILQFLMESIILVGFATLFSLVFYTLLRSGFSHVIQEELPVITAFPSYFLLFPLLLIILLGLTAGMYPALVLSSVKSADSLKGKLSSVKDQVWLRKALIGLQFAIATISFVAAILISEQVNLFFKKDLGYNKDYIVTALTPRNWSSEGVNKMERIRSQFAAIPDVQNAALSYEIPDGGNGASISFYRYGSDSTHAIGSSLLTSDEYFASTYAIPMAAGEFFGSPGTVVDSLKLVINETESKAFGWKTPQEAIGKLLKTPGDSRTYKVAGVVKDFNFFPLNSGIGPISFEYIHATNTFRVLSFKLRPGNIGKGLNALRQKWTKLLPGAPFEYTFVDESLARTYKTEMQLKQATTIAFVLSFIIVFLGIIGLVSISIQKRKKEIAIRKVLGSSIQSIINLFILETLPVILIAGSIACPIVLFLIKNWLDGYAYKINLGPFPFIFSVLSLGLVSACLIVIQTFKSARSNPVESLRSE